LNLTATTLYDFASAAPLVSTLQIAHIRKSCLSCCNLSGGVALNVWFTTKGMCVKNNTIHICGAN